MTRHELLDTLCEILTLSAERLAAADLNKNTGIVLAVNAIDAEPRLYSVTANCQPELRQVETGRLLREVAQENYRAGDALLWLSPGKYGDEPIWWLIHEGAFVQRAIHYSFVRDGEPLCWQPYEGAEMPGELGMTLIPQSAAMN